MLSMSVLTQVSDLTSVVNKISTETFVDTSAIHLLGVSQGGVVNSLYIANNPNKIKSQILLFPAFVLFDDIRQTYASLGVSAPSDIPATITHRNAKLGAIYLQDALTIYVDQFLPIIKQPTLIIHGTQDTVVPYRYSEQAKQLIPNTQLIKIEGAGHRLDQHFNQVAMPAVEHFLTGEQ